MSKIESKSITTDGLRQIQTEAVRNKSGRVLSQDVAVDVLSGLPQILQTEINRGNHVIVDYTGLVTVHKREKGSNA